MRYRLDGLPVQLAAPTARLAEATPKDAPDLLEALAARRARSEDVRLSRGELHATRVAPGRRISFVFPGSGGERPAAEGLIEGLRRWVGLSQKDFVHELHESPATLGRRLEAALEERGDRGFFVRLEEGRVRAILPPEYRPLDHVEAASAFRDACERWRRAGVDVWIETCEEDGDELLLAAVAPSLAAEVREGDWLYAGIVLANSECGPEPLEARPRIYRVACANGAIAQEAEAEGFEVQKVPAPAPCRPEEAPILACFRERLVRAFDLAFRPERVEHEAAVGRAAALSSLASPFEHLQHVVAQGLLTEEERDAARRLFEEERDASLYGLANAVTAAAHGRRRQTELRRAFALERLGAEIARGDHGPPIGVPVHV